MQFLNIKSQEASLSIDRLVFGRMPQRSTMTKMSILKNTGRTPIRFNLNNPDWYSEDPNDDSASVVHIYPSEGTLKPGNQQLLKVTVNASAYPRVINKTVAIQLMHPPQEIPTPSASAAEDKDAQRMAMLKTKVGDSPHESVSFGETLSRIGAKVQTALNKCAMLSRYEDEKAKEILGEVYLLLMEAADRNASGSKFLETVIMKLIKVGMKDDIDELALEGTAPPRTLENMMHELEETYKRKRKEPEIMLAFMLYGLDNDSLPSPTKPKPGMTSTEGKVSFSDSLDESQGSMSSLPSTGMRGTMVVSRGSNRAKAAELSAKKPAKTFLYLQVTGEIVEEEPYFAVFGGDLKEAGLRIPTKREFVANPTEVVPSRLVTSKDGLISDDGSGDRAGEYGGPKQAAPVKDLVTSMFTELVSSNDLVMQFAELPSNPRNPYLGEVQRRPPLMTSLQAAFDLFDVDASGTLTNSEVTSALQHIGLSHKDASVKKFLKELDKNGDNEVDMREFLEGLTPEMAHKIANALETNEDMIVSMRAERQRIMEGMRSPVASPRNESRKHSQQAVALGLVQDDDDDSVAVVEETEEMNSAALMIQKRQRVRKAKQEVNQKR